MTDAMKSTKAEKQEVNEQIDSIIKNYGPAKAAELFRKLNEVNAGDNFHSVMRRLIKIAESSN
jgi:hypothetical protein